MREMCQTFGITALGETVESWTLENEFLTAEVLTYGAALRRLVFGGVDVVLGYDTLSEYERNDGYVGATVGRVCNRIGGASFELNGKTYPLAKNDERTISTAACGDLTNISGRRSRWRTACGCTVCRLTGRRGIPERWRCR